MAPKRAAGGAPGLRWRMVVSTARRKTVSRPLMTAGL
jgi:hypothetical protein